ncbi:MAG TPA: asparagine--tRNA ligase [Candidatus Thermoplasmatota archaeon]|nr:asparagine--tRNA ligase [Candidatus Thermoplasmatota archaeon]
MTTPIVRIRDVLAGKHTGEKVTLRGWVWRYRTSGKIVFATLRDATGTIQTTTKKGVATDAGFEQAQQAAMEASVSLTGTVKADERAPGGFEIGVDDFQLVGKSTDFPIYESTIDADAQETLLDKRHLFLRSRHLTSSMILRAKTLQAFREWFDARSFYEVTPSVITTNNCEGGSEVFEFDYFGQKAFLSQSSQLYLEALIYGLERVYCLLPSFRAEKSRTRKHLTEFQHLEAEEAWVDNAGNMEIQEELVTYVAHRVAVTALPQLQELGRDPQELLRIQTPFKRYTYDDAIAILRKKDYDRGRDAKGRKRGAIEWGEDLGAPDEVALVEGETQPVFVKDWPADMKAFYMHSNGDGTVANADMIAPEGYGEIIGGSQRSVDNEWMKQRLEAQAKRDGTPLDLNAYEWYFDLRRYGSVPHSGFGLGTERVVRWLGKLEHIRDATPFPRTPSRAYP